MVAKRPKSLVKANFNRIIVLIAGLRVLKNNNIKKISNGSLLPHNVLQAHLPPLPGKERKVNYKIIKILASIPFAELCTVT